LIWTAYLVRWIKKNVNFSEILMKPSWSVIAVIGCLLTLVTAAPLCARLLYWWSDEELLDKSDLVLIATPTATKDTRERIDLPGIISVGPGGKETGVPAIGVETMFRVSAVLKGDKAIKEFVLHHYREPETDLPSINGPFLVSFDPEEKSRCLLFLVREADGRYAPTSGQTDPGIDAVQALGGMNKSPRPKVGEAERGGSFQGWLIVGVFVCVAGGLVVLGFALLRHRRKGPECGEPILLPPPAARIHSPDVPESARKRFNPSGNSGDQGAIRPADDGVRGEEK
jgi:hypothetical protein